MPKVRNWGDADEAILYKIKKKAINFLPTTHHTHNTSTPPPPPPPPPPPLLPLPPKMMSASEAFDDEIGEDEDVHCPT
jgi:hypothetical protein